VGATPESGPGDPGGSAGGEPQSDSGSDRWRRCVSIGDAEGARTSESQCQRCTAGIGGDAGNWPQNDEKNQFSVKKGRRAAIAWATAAGPRWLSREHSTAAIPPNATS